MARVILVRDLAWALAAAGHAPVRDGALVTGIDLEIAAHVAAPPTTASIWNLRLRYPDPPRLAWLARWRRARRRREGVGIAMLLLRWTPGRLDALLDGRVIACLDPISGGTIDEHAAEDAAS